MHASACPLHDYFAVCKGIKKQNVEIRAKRPTPKLARACAARPACDGVYKTRGGSNNMCARTALALLCAAAACARSVRALALPCRFFEFSAGDGTCRACAEHTFGTHAHCARYNATLPWANATSVFERLQLGALADACEQYATTGGNSTDAAVARLCDHLGTDGELAPTAVLAPASGARTAYEPRPPALVPIRCAQGSFAVNDTDCMPCPRNTTTDAGNKTSEFACEWCQLGFRWQPQTRSCARCPACYTTRPDADNKDADYTRAEQCVPCSVWADDYRRGGCDPTVAGQCVLHVPYADVHAVHMQPPGDAEYASRRGVLCSYEVWREANSVGNGQTNEEIKFCKDQGLVDAQGSPCTQVQMYVYAAPTQHVHALFRPQSRDHLYDLGGAYASAHAAYAATPPNARGFTYTTGTALPGAADDLWRSNYSQRSNYPYSAAADNVPPPFEISGSYTYNMHEVSGETAPYYDLARAYHEHWLRGLLRPSQANCARAGPPVGVDCARRKLEEYGILLCGDALDEQRLWNGDSESCAVDPTCDVLGIFCANDPNDSWNQPFCDSTGESIDVWKTLQFYLYNATEQYVAMEEGVKEWEQALAGRTRAGAPEVGACDRTRADLHVVVSNTHGTLEATLREIRVRQQADNETLYEQALAETLAPLSLAFEHNFSVFVPVGSRVQVDVLVSNGSHIQVQVQLAGADVHTTTSPSTYFLPDEYIVCEDSTAEELVRVQTPADFDKLHPFLSTQLCPYA